MAEKIKNLIKFLIFLYLTTNVSAGQILPKGASAQNILFAIQKKDIRGLKKYSNVIAGVEFHFYEDTRVFWIQKLGEFEKSELVKLLFQTDLLRQKYRLEPPGKHLFSLSDVLNRDFYAEEWYKFKPVAAKINGKNYGEGTIYVYSENHTYRITMHCTSKADCLINRFYIVDGDEIIFRKACTTNKDMHGQPMKKTVCPTH